MFVTFDNVSCSLYFLAFSELASNSYLTFFELSLLSDINLATFAIQFFVSIETVLIFSSKLTNLS